MRQFLTIAVFAGLAVLATPLSAMQTNGTANPAERIGLMRVEQQAALHCSAIFVATYSAQIRNETWAKSYPDMQRFGQPYFIDMGDSITTATGMEQETIGNEIMARTAEVYGKIARLDDPQEWVDGQMRDCSARLAAHGFFKGWELNYLTGQEDNGEDSPEAEQNIAQKNEQREQDDEILKCAAYTRLAWAEVHGREGDNDTSNGLNEKATAWEQQANKILTARIWNGEQAKSWLAQLRLDIWLSSVILEKQGKSSHIDFEHCLDRASA